MSPSWTTNVYLLLARHERKLDRSAAEGNFLAVDERMEPVQCATLSLEQKSIVS